MKCIRFHQIQITLFWIAARLSVSPRPGTSGVILSCNATLRLHMGVCGASPRLPFGSFMNATRPIASEWGSLTFTLKGIRFSRKAKNLRLNWSPDFVIGTRFPPNSMKCDFPSRTYQCNKTKRLFSSSNLSSFEIYCPLVKPNIFLMGIQKREQLFLQI